MLKRDKIVLDWRKEQATRASVRVAVEEILDRLPDVHAARSTHRNASRLPARLRQLLGRWAVGVHGGGVASRFPSTLNLQSSSCWIHKAQNFDDEVVDLI